LEGRIVKRRLGFALHQLLLVIAVLAILIGLLLPAVQKVREAAARLQSANNLKHIGIALHSHQATYNRLPSGVDGNNFSASYHLLPFLEQEPLYKAITATGKGVDDKATRNWCVPVKVFISPLDDAPLEGKFGPTNYLFVAGTKPGLKDNDGVFYRDSKLSIVVITGGDGTSNTIAVVETLAGDATGRQARTSLEIEARAGWTAASSRGPSPSRAPSTAQSPMLTAAARAAWRRFGPGILPPGCSCATGLSIRRCRA
jgi:type II secretory pathway pseudopilin PulG